MFLNLYIWGSVIISLSILFFGIFEHIAKKRKWFGKEEDPKVGTLLNGVFSIMFFGLVFLMLPFINILLFLAIAIYSLLFLIAIVFDMNNKVFFKSFYKKLEKKRNEEIKELFKKGEEDYLKNKK